MNKAEVTPRKVRRGISISQGNEEIVSEARQEILGKLEEDEKRERAPKEATHHTFLLPKLTCYPLKFRAYLENDLIEQAVLINLEQSDRLNWWCNNDCMQRLWPMATTGDGNCLLHAASLAMWGFHDRHLTLRHALHHRLIHDNVSFYRRWVYQSVQDQKLQGFTLSQKEFEEEWSDICNLSFPSPKGSHAHFDLFPKDYESSYLSCCQSEENFKERSSDKSPIRKSPSKTYPSKKNKSLPPICISSKDSYYDFLEQIHVFVLSQVLRRPILIISDTYVRDADGQPIQPLLFGGIYLPLLEKPGDCEKSPILLTYSNSHFSALVPMNLEEVVDCKQLPLGVPLIDPLSFELLPIHFAVDPGDSWINSNFNSLSKKPSFKSLMKTYLNCEDFKFCPHHKRRKQQTELIREDSLDSLGEPQKHSLTRTIGKQIKERFSTKSTKLKSTSIANDSSQKKKQTINWDKFSEHVSVFGAKLQIHLTSNYKEMIDNYLKNAEVDFEVLQNKGRRTSIEFMSKVNFDKENTKNCHIDDHSISVPIQKSPTNHSVNSPDINLKRISSKKCLEPS